MPGGFLDRVRGLSATSGRIVERLFLIQHSNKKRSITHPKSVSKFSHPDEKRVDSPGFEPGTLRMRSGCDTTTPQAPEGWMLGEL